MRAWHSYVKRCIQYVRLIGWTESPTSIVSVIINKNVSSRDVSHNRTDKLRYSRASEIFSEKNQTIIFDRNVHVWGDRQLGSEGYVWNRTESRRLGYAITHRLEEHTEHMFWIRDELASKFEANLHLKKFCKLSLYHNK